MSRYLDTSSTTQVAQILVQHRRPVVPLERHLYGHPRETIGKSSIGTRMVNSTELGMSIWSSKTRTMLVGKTWTTPKMAGRKKDLSPVWKKLMKLVDPGEPTSFLDHVYWGCTQRECKSNENITE